MQTIAQDQLICHEQALVQEACHWALATARTLIPQRRELGSRHHRMTVACAYAESHFTVEGVLRYSTHGITWLSVPDIIALRTLRAEIREAFAWLATKGQGMHP
jgi:hypothetical protein